MQTRKKVETKSKNNKLIVYLLFVVIALVWGLSFVGIKYTLEDYTPVELLAVRWGISGFLFIVLALLKIIKVDFRGKPKGTLFLLCLFQPGIYSIFEAAGVKFATSSESSIFIGAIPLMVVIESFLILRQKVNKKSVVGVTIGFIGLLSCICFNDNFATGSAIKGYVFLIIAMIAGASYAITCKKATKYYSTSEITFAMAVFGGIEFNIISFVESGFKPYEVFFQGGTVTLAVLYLAILSGMVAYAINNYNLSRLPAVVASCVQQNSINLVGVVAGIIINHDQWGWYTVVGLILISLGILLTTLSDDE